MVTKSEIQEYINGKPFLNIYPYGQFWRVRIGERSHMEGKFTDQIRADRALQMHVGNVILQTRKNLAKREANKKLKE